jgi:hypothetical protein
VQLKLVISEGITYRPARVKLAGEIGWTLKNRFVITATVFNTTRSLDWIEEQTETRVQHFSSSLISYPHIDRVVAARARLLLSQTP